MDTNWKKSKKFKPGVVLKDLEDHKTVHDGGGMSYDGFFGTFGLDFAASTLTGMVEFPSTLEPKFRSNLVRRTITDVAREETLTPESFIAHLKKLVKDELGKPEKTFHVLTSLSLEKSNIKHLSVDGTSIRILPYRFPKKYQSRGTIEFDKQHQFKTSYRYANTIITVKSRHADAAFTKGMDALDLVRAIWNFLTIPRWELGPSDWTPINRVRTGSIHTLHKQNGALAVERYNYWYEPNFVETRPFNAIQHKHFPKNTRFLLKRVHECRYSKQLKTAMLRYVRALDERDSNVAVIKLWSALEALTSPTQANYDQVVRRIAFIHYDHKILLQVLEQLREIRNRNIHAGEELENARFACFFLANCFGALFKFHTGNIDKFSTLDDANNFLDLPVSKTALNKRKVLIEHALKYRKLE